jgi:type II secretory pathway predicted ATPase ExeA
VTGALNSSANVGMHGAANGALLRQALKSLRLRQADLAAQIGLSRPALTAAINHGVWPVRADRATVCARMADVLRARAMSESDIALALQSIPGAAIPAVRKERPGVARGKTGPEVSPTTTAEDPAMLLRKQNLTEAARKRFSLADNPFAADVETEEDLYLTPDVRYVREALMHAARNAGFVAVVGESGAGKSTIREDLIDRISKARREIVVIQPSVLGLEDSDRKGKTLKASAIADSIIWGLDPGARAPLTMQAKAKRVQRMLEDSAAAGNKHVLLIEEAHCLPKATLKHLKRFHELKAGRVRLLGIVLIGQPELLTKLSEHDPEVREVTQRCEIATLEPMDRYAREYIEHRLKRVGRSVRDVMDDGALAAMLGRLTLGKPGEKGYRSLCYPLAINNLMTIALNAAASVDLSSINADVMRRAA